MSKKYFLFIFFYGISLAKADVINFPVGKGELFLFNSSSDIINIKNIDIIEDGNVTGSIDDFPLVFYPNQRYNISLTENISDNAQRIQFETDRDGINGFIYDIKTNMFYNVIGGIDCAGK